MYECVWGMSRRYSGLRGGVTGGDVHVIDMYTYAGVRHGAPYALRVSRTLLCKAASSHLLEGALLVGVKGGHALTHKQPMAHHGASRTAGGLCILP